MGGEWAKVEAKLAHKSSLLAEGRRGSSGPHGTRALQITALCTGVAGSCDSVSPPLHAPLPEAALLRDLCQLAEPQHPHCSQTTSARLPSPVQRCQVGPRTSPCSPSGLCSCCGCCLQLVTCAQTAPDAPVA